MSWTTGRFYEELLPGLHTLTVDSYKNKRTASMWKELLTLKTSKRSKEETLDRSGTGFPTAKGESAPVTFDTQIAGRKQTYIPVVYSMACRISEEAIEDNLYELNNGQDGLGPIFYDIGESFAENEEVLAARLYNYSTVTTYNSTRHGKALFATDHPRLDGTTFSNKATSADLTYSTFWAAVTAAENQFNHRQHRVSKKVKNLWIPPQLERQGLEILKSTDRPDTGNRATNAMAASGRKIGIKKWQHMTDTDMWVLQLEGGGLWRFNLRKTRFSREKEFTTGDMMVKGDQRFSIGIEDEKCLYGVVPA